MIKAKGDQTHINGTLPDLLSELANIVESLKDGGIDEMAIRHSVGLGLTEPDKKGEYTKEHESELIKAVLNSITDKED